MSEKCVVINLQTRQKTVRSTRFDPFCLSIKCNTTVPSTRFYPFLSFH